MQKVLFRVLMLMVLSHGVAFGAFINNGDGTVTDTATGLMWQEETADEMTWEEAITYCEDLSLGGYTDWRLPNRNELQSIVDYSEYNPAVDTNAFPDTMSSDYWSSTTNADLTDNAWLVNFNYGYVYTVHAWIAILYNGGVSHDGKSDSYYVRAVRGGQNWSLGYLVISAPEQGATYEIGSEQTITWRTQDIPGNVKISLSRQAGKDGTFETITESTENDGSYTWTVTGPESANCMLKIEPLSDTSKATTQGLFNVETVGGSGGGGGGCFVATAAFGSPMETHVTILKNFRDTYLLPCSLGRIFVRTYNKYSPPIANFIAKHDTLKMAVRIGLLPIVAFSYSMLHFGSAITVIGLLLIFMFPILLISVNRRGAGGNRVAI